MGDGTDEGVDAIAGREGRSWRQGTAQFDRAGLKRYLLVGLAQRSRNQVCVPLVLATAGKGDLARVAAQVGPALGEDQPRLLRPAVQRQEDCGIGSATGLNADRLFGGEEQFGEVALQMITCTVPPSTDQAAPLT